MRIYGIHDNVKDKIVYIGRTVNVNDFNPHGKHIYKLVKRYPTRYNYVVIDDNISNEQILNEKEIFYITKYNTFNDPECYNFTKGGSGGFTLAKATSEERHKIKQKELYTKMNNPEIMKNAAKKGRETFLSRPKDERDKIIKERFKKSLITRQKNKDKLTDEQKKQKQLKHSNQVKQIHKDRSPERKKEINEKIRKALCRTLITLKNKNTGEILSLYSTEWQRKYNVRTWFLINNKQRSSHGWYLLSR